MTAGITERANFRRNAGILLAALFVVGAASLWYWWPPKGEESPPPLPGTDPAQFELPDITPTSFRNAAKTVGFVGTRECIGCHRREHQSYLRTTHSRSLADLDLAKEAPDGEFRHELSGRSYHVFRDGMTLRLREFTQSSDGKEVLLADHTARYALGSGNYSRMYLIKLDDFLIEAPVTWYPRKQAWGMSAGYEKDPLQPGFRRAIDAGCLDCHAGRVERIGNAGERLKVVEAAISCEKCHGPGELHVKERREALPTPDTGDDTIVNPRHLSRDRQEDICAQCHFSSLANIAIRGRSTGDFRPGMKMADFVIKYRIDRPDTAMTVSGQIEQMRLSKCYVESKAMTCTTCHELHGRGPEMRTIEHYRNACLSCHKSESCKLPVPTRKEKDANDYCVTCHMPRGPTDIPHFSFTHHRIGIHAAKPPGKLTEADQLVPVGDVSHLPMLERRRQLGLANDLFAGKLTGGLDDATRYDPAYKALATVFRMRGRQILEEVRGMGLRDPDVEDFFGRWHWRKNPEQCIGHAKAALDAPRVSPATRKSALYNLATSHFDLGRYDLAFPYLEELAKCERSEITLMLLAICHQKKGNRPETVRLINDAIGVSPDRADLHSFLAPILRDMGQAKAADEHLERAKLLRLKIPQPK